ncbi:MAG TPA: O-antigen ligase domain-containing protein [Saprospiraceae bacterium]|nr:O-antigen ligase domain-containing protein [Saprospiraceae bacterium]
MIASLKSWITEKLMLQKLNNPLGYLLMIIITACLGYGLSVIGMKYSMLLLGMIIGLPALGACFVNLRFGIAVILILGFLVEFFRKYTSAPIGTALDGINYTMIFGMLVMLTKDRDFRFAKNPISIMVVIWVLYNLIQVLNPWAVSKMAWLYTVRSMAGLILIYFAASFSFKSLKHITWTIKLIIGLSFLSALYGLKQEYIGFTPQELTWLYSDEERFQLIFQWSRLRIFSFFSDPTTYGILMGYMLVFCTILLLGPYKIAQKIWLAIGVVLMLACMAYAGSRTPVILIPAGFIFFVMVTFKKEIIIASAVVFVLGAAFMMKSSGNPVIFRIQSAFNPKTSGDTMEVRFENQKIIQPFIHRHPFGAGLGSCGQWGKRFSPDSFLADFPHDSGLVRIAVELGWIGLIIYSLFLFQILKTGLYYYYRVVNPKIKNLYLALTTVMFILALASYPQEAIVLLPTSIVFYVFLAAIVRLKDFDDPIPIEMMTDPDENKKMGYLLYHRESEAEDIHAFKPKT